MIELSNFQQHSQIFLAFSRVVSINICYKATMAEQTVERMRKHRLEVAARIKARRQTPASTPQPYYQGTMANRTVEQMRRHRLKVAARIKARTQAPGPTPVPDGGNLQEPDADNLQQPDIDNLQEPDTGNLQEPDFNPYLKPLKKSNKAEWRLSTLR